MKRKYKKLEEENDLTILKEYESQRVVPIIFPRTILFFSFMIVLYYSNYARWFFWVLIGLTFCAIILFFSNKIKPYHSLLRDELINRGYNEN